MEAMNQRIILPTISLLTQLENGEVKSFSMQPERGVYEVRGAA